MASETLRPSGAGNYTNWDAAVGAATHWEAVDDVTPDDGATFIRQSTVSVQARDSFALEASALGGGESINSVTVHFRATATADADPNDQVTPFLRLSATDSDGTPQALAVGYTNYSEIVSRPGGGGWSVSDLASLEVGVIGERDVVSAGNTRCTQTYIVVDYDPPAPFFYHHQARHWRKG